jgi:hypothetical protein
MADLTIVLRQETTRRERLGMQMTIAAVTRKSSLDRKSLVPLIAKQVIFQNRKRCVPLESEEMGAFSGAHPVNLLNITV